MNQMYAEAGEDVRFYTSLMSKIHLHTLTESITAATIVFNSSLAQQIPTYPFDSTILERSVKKIQCDGSKTLLRTLLLFQGRTADVGLVLLALTHLLTGTDSKDKRTR